MKRPILLALAGLTVFAGSCVRRDSPTQVDGPVALPLAINPAVVSSPANAGAAPINRIRAVAARVEDAVVIGESVVDVDPAAEEWEVGLEVRASSDPVDVDVFVFLLHTENDLVSTEFSGLAGPITVVAGDAVEPADVTLVRGPIDNLFVTNVSVSSSPDTLYEGASAPVEATTTTSNQGSPTVYWTSLDSLVLETDSSSVTALAPGTGRIVASSGAFGDTAEVYVRPAPASIVVSPVLDSIGGPGERATFTAAVLDTRGDTLVDESVTWRSGTPLFIQSLGGGVFEGVAAGAGVVEAVSVAIPSVTGSAILVVEAGQTVDPSDLSLELEADETSPGDGDLVQLTVRIVNGTGAGAVEATNVEVTHVVAAGASLLGATPDQGTFDLPGGLWTLGTLATGDTAQLILDLQMPLGAGGQVLADSAWISAVDQADPDASNDTATVSFGVVPRPVDVEILKTVDVPQPLPGSTATFTVSVVNNGPGTVSDLTVHDTLEAVLTAPQHQVTRGALVDDTLWTIPSIPEGDTVRWTTSVTVSPDAGGGTATNSAVLRSIAQNDTVPANDTATISVNFPISAIPVVTIASPADGSVFDPGDLVTFTAAANDAEEGDLSPSIQWASSIDGALGTGRSFETDQLSTGLHVVSASATDSDDGTGADTVRVTVALITTPATLNVPFGGTASLPISLTEPAPSGGLTVDVSATDPGTASPASPTVFIAEGTLSANATIQGVQPGVTQVSISNPQYGASSTTVSVTADLNILQSSAVVPATFPQPIDVRLESAGSPIAAPAGGLALALTAVDPSCVSVPGSSTIPAGLVSQSVTLSYGGSATLPCSSWVRATATAVATDSVLVNVDPTPGISVNSTSVGSGLQYGNFSASLQAGQHGGTTVRIESSDPSTFLVSPDVNTAGTPFIDVFLPNGSQSAGYWVHGLEGVDAAANLVVSAPGFTTNATATVTVVPPALDVLGLTTSPVVFSPEDPFLVRVGLPNPALTGMSIEQRVRVGGDTLTATVTSTETAVGELVTLPDSASPVTVVVPPGVSRSSGTVASGGVAFRGVSVGSTDVAATIPGVLSLPTATVTVSVGAAGISVAATTVGSGLQYGAFNGTLAASQHGDVTVRIESSNPQVLLIAPDNTTPGTAFINVPVANGFTQARYWVQGVEGTVGSAQVNVSAPGFQSGSATVDVVQPSFDLLGVDLTQTTLSPDDPFLIRTGVPNGQLTGLSIEQSIRAGGVTAVATVTSDDPTSADLVTLPDSASPVTVSVAPGVARSPSTVAAGGVAIDPVNAGTPTISATIPGFVPVTTSSRAVTVTAPVISVSDATVGAGLQYGTFSAALGASQHGGVTVRVESTDPQSVLVSPDASTPGTAFVDIQLADGLTAASYWVHGVEGATGSVPLTVSAPGFVTNTTATVSVVQPGLDIIGLTTPQTTLSPNDPFLVRLGVPNGQQTGLQIEQSIRAGAAALDVGVTSSDIGVGLLRTSSTAGGSVSVPVAAGTSRSANTLATGGVEFDPQGQDTTIVSASATGFVTVSNGFQEVVVNAPGISVPTTTVGSGLQYGTFNAILGATQHGGVTVTVKSSNPQVLRIAPDAQTEGSDSIQVVLANGQTAASYWVQGVEGATGTATVLVTANGFTDGSAPVNVVQPAVDVLGVTPTYSAADPVDPVWARVGVPNGNDTGLQIVQAIRVGGTSISVTFASSDPAAALVATESASGASAVLTLSPGDSRTPTSIQTGGVGLEPVAAGSTDFTARIPGFIPVANATVRVTINP